MLNCIFLSKLIRLPFYHFIVEFFQVMPISNVVHSNYFSCSSGAANFVSPYTYATLPAAAAAAAAAGLPTANTAVSAASAFPGLSPYTAAAAAAAASLQEARLQ